MTKAPEGPLTVHLSEQPNLIDFLHRLEEDFEEIEKALKEHREICVTVHIGQQTK